MQYPPEKPVFRFAPSPNGELHLGHAFSALLNFDMARAKGGVFLLRIEDIDITRCTPELEQAMLEDLHWLGISWQGEPRRQSDHFENYRTVLETLEAEELLYPAFLSRGALRRLVEEKEATGFRWPRDPDGVLLYPDVDRKMDSKSRTGLLKNGEGHALRLDMAKAVKQVSSPLFLEEDGSGPDGESGLVKCDPLAWGDVVLGRREIPTSYHLSVVIDDALQGVTHIVRGSDLFHATSVHRLLQELLGLSAPRYHHHDLILAEDGRKLAKRHKDTSLRTLRKSGATPGDIRRMVGL